MSGKTESVDLWLDAEVIDYYSSLAMMFEIDFSSLINIILKMKLKEKSCDVQ